MALTHHARDEARFLTGCGEMGALVSDHAWSATPLGPIERWPPQLRTAAQMVLASPLPTVLAWTPQLIAVHNDAYRDLLGDKPIALGRPLLDIWAEIRTELGALFKRAFSGEAIRTEGAPFTIYRHGRLEQAFFDYGLSPVRVGSLDMLQRKGLGGEREQRLIAGAAQPAERARVLVQRLLAFARRQPLQPITVDIAELITGMTELVESTTGPHIKVMVDLAADLPAAEADPNQLEMALLNLAVNARDAMPEGGTLRISASSDVVPRGATSTLRAGRYILVSVADTGTGMDETTAARAIEPFFSTKGVGQGTGLGLSMVHGLASQLGGELTIKSARYRHHHRALAAAGRAGTQGGYIPPRHATGARGRDRAAGGRRGDRPHEHGRDARGSRLPCRRGRIGRKGVADHRGGHASRPRRHRSSYAGHDGTDLARIVRDCCPDIPVLVISGFTEVDGVASDLPRLAKPFRRDELAMSLATLPRSEQP